MSDQVTRSDHQDGVLTARTLRRLIAGLPNDAEIKIRQNDLDDYRNRGVAHWWFDASWTPPADPNVNETAQEMRRKATEFDERGPEWAERAAEMRESADELDWPMDGQARERPNPEGMS